jgi:hypothetical protein
VVPVVIKSLLFPAPGVASRGGPAHYAHVKAPRRKAP